MRIPRTRRSGTKVWALSALLAATALVILGPAAPPVAAYTTPDTGVSWTMADLVANSGGAVILLNPPSEYVLRETLVVAASDTVRVLPGDIVRVEPGFAIYVDGQLRSGGPGQRVEFRSNASSPAPADWGFIRVNGTADFMNTLVRHAQAAFSVAGSLTFRDGWITDNHPVSVVVFSGDLTMDNATVYGGSLTGDGGGGVGNLGGRMVLTNSTVVGGNGTVESLGGVAVYVDSPAGPSVIRDNVLIAGGVGGNAYSFLDAGAGGPGIQVDTVADGFPPYAVEIAGNAVIRGGAGGTQYGMDAVAGAGGHGIAVVDAPVNLGSVLIENDGLILGGPGGAFDGAITVGGPWTLGGAGGDALFTGGVESIRVVNSTLLGGDGGDTYQSGALSPPQTSYAGPAGAGILANSGLSLVVLNSSVAGGHGGDSLLGSGYVSGGNGGPGLSANGLAITVTYSSLTGGRGGDDTVSAGGSDSGGGEGGPGASLVSAEAVFVAAEITGGRGGDSLGDGTYGPGNGYYGLAATAGGNLTVTGGNLTGGAGGDQTSAALNLPGGTGSAALSAFGLWRAVVDGTGLYGGDGGDAVAGSGNGGYGDSPVTAGGNSERLEVRNARVVAGSGGQAFGGGSPGPEGYYGVFDAGGNANFTLEGNAFLRAQFYHLSAASPVTFRGNDLAGGAQGVFLSGAASNSLIEGNAFNVTNTNIGCTDATNVTVRGGSMLQGGYALLAANCQVSLSEFIAVTGGILVQSSSVIATENVTIGGAITATTGTNVTTLNTTFNGAAVTANGGSRVVVRNFLAVRTEDALAAPLPGSDVRVLDNGLPVYASPGFGGADAVTDAAGEVRWIVVTDRIYDDSSLATENATTAEVASGPLSFFNNPRDVAMAASHTEVFAPPDPDPPQIAGVLLDGQPSRIVGTGAIVLVTATVDDTATGGTPILSANVTVGAGNWASSQPLAAADGSFDGPAEAVTGLLDSALAPEGLTAICVYGADLELGNLTGACATLEVDRSAPQVSNLRFDGALPPAVIPVQGTVRFTATVDDTASGGHIVTGATALWNGFPLGPTVPQDGAFDGPTEDVYYDYPYIGAEGSFHAACVDGRDEVANNASSCGVLHLLTPPTVLFPAINGSASWTALAGVVVNVTGVVRDLGFGDSAIVAANVTVGAQNWGSAQAMGALDGALDTADEPVFLLLDTATVPPGTHALCLYAVDAAGAQNLTGACATLTVLAADTLPPLLVDFRLDNTQAAITVVRGDTVGIYGAASDAASGGSLIASGNVTVDGDWAGAIALGPADGTFDETAEEFNGVLFTASLTLGLHVACLHAEDAAGNGNLTGRCLDLTVTDPLPPRITFVQANGVPAVSVLQGAPVTLRAYVDDTQDALANPLGLSVIASANYTVDGSWAGSVSMAAEDGAFDSFLEWVTAVVNTGALALGAHVLCVHAADAAGNANVSMAACASLTVLGADLLPPEILNLLLQVPGSPSQPGPITVLRGTDVAVLADATDAPAGGANITAANVTLDGSWATAVPMAAVDGAFDEVSELVSYDSFETAGWSLGTHDLCVYATDDRGNANVTGLCTSVTVVDDAAPAVALALNGIPGPISVVSGAVVNVSASLSDAGLGESAITAANVTVDGAWSGAILLVPADGAFDSLTEAGYALLASAALAAGDHSVCVNTADAAGNRNLSACLTLRILTSDTLPPQILELTIDGSSGTLTAVRGASLTIRALVSDVATGGSNLSAANVTLDGDWLTSTSLFPESGNLTAQEWMARTYATGGIPSGTHQLCVSAGDARSNLNLMGLCRTLNLLEPVVITHTPAARALLGENLTLAFQVEGGGTATATVFYRLGASGPFLALAAGCTGTNCTAMIPAQVTAGTLYYYLQVEDEVQTVTLPAAGAAAPFEVLVIDVLPPGPDTAWVWWVVAATVILVLLALLLLLRRRQRKRDDESPATPPSEPEPPPEASREEGETQAPEDAQPEARDDAESRP